MPRAFLVKKVNITNAKKNWSQLPDSVRGDIYVPCEYHHYVNVLLDIHFMLYE